MKAKDKEVFVRGAKALTALLDYAAISSSSRSIIKFNIARLYCAAEDTGQAKKYLAEADVDKNKIIKNRLSLDQQIKKLYEDS